MSGPKRRLLKVVILGDGGVGKSCLMNRYVTNHFDESSFHTIGVEFLSKEIEIGAHIYTLQIWDTAGQERFRSLRTPFYRGSDMCLLVCALDDRNSFDNLTQWRSEFLNYADVHEPATFPFAVLANKNDMAKDKWQLTEEDVQQWCTLNGDLPCIMTSAKSALNVSEAFSLAVDAWSRRELDTQPEYSADFVDLKKLPDNTTSSSCCLTTS